jgi:hypothetical protein
MQRLAEVAPVDVKVTNADVAYSTTHTVPGGKMADIQANMLKAAAVSSSNALTPSVLVGAPAGSGASLAFPRIEPGQDATVALNGFSVNRPVMLDITSSCNPLSLIREGTPLATVTYTSAVSITRMNASLNPYQTFPALGPPSDPFLTPLCFMDVCVCGLDRLA